MNVIFDKGSGSPRVTMQDVADAAGVSLKSVSRVVNNEPHVTRKLREKVEGAIAAMGYVPDMAARSLAGARNFLVAVMFDNPSPNYTMQVVSGAYQACREHDYHLQIDNLDSLDLAGTPAERVRAILHNSRLDGVILTPPLCDNSDILDLLEAGHVRYSRISPLLEPDRSPSVGIDDAMAAANVAELFHRQGHRRIGLVNGPQSHGAARTRREGFLQRMAQLAPEVVVNEADAGFLFEGGIAAGRELLSARRYPTAIFAANDDSAAGVMAACAQMGFSVPDDVSVCGFDDSWVAKSVWPYLTTVRQPIREMAHAATLMLIDRRNAPGARPSVKMDFQLIERASVAPPR